MENHKLVACMLDMGEILLTSGAEVNRIEDTLARIGAAYHFQRVDVFTITASIVLTVHTADGEIITQTRRIKGAQVDMERIDKVNYLSRKICEKEPAVKYIENEIREIKNITGYPEWLIGIAYFCVAGAFAVFFGGDIMDGAAAGIAAVVLRVMLRIGQRIRMNALFLNMMCSAVVGIVVMVLTRIGIGHSVDEIVIGNVMLLIPGVALTTSLRDIIGGDIISGLLEMTEAILKAAAIAMGFAVLLLPL
ncbi:MAG: threonine/serine exporter family protein [Lachnospiraceae bacterium]|nr:threonine/serine exporter family protein [Lachnospiraceae bacterium]